MDSGRYLNNGDAFTFKRKWIYAEQRYSDDHRAVSMTSDDADLMYEGRAVRMLPDRYLVTGVPSQGNPGEIQQVRRYRFQD